MLQTCRVKKCALAVWRAIWADRTGLEQILLLVSAGLVGLVVALVIALVRESAPAATEWGPVADWVGAVVTFLGFVGAIAALRVQRKSVDVQVQQHNKIERAEKAVAVAKEAALAAEALKDREKEARAVKLTVSVGRPKPPPGSKFVYPPPFNVRCHLLFPPGANYTDVEFKHPDIPDEFRFLMDTTREPKFSTDARDVRIYWEISGDEWPHGPEDEAQTWVAERTSVTFKDSAGVAWKLDGAGSLAEVDK